MKSDDANKENRMTEVPTEPKDGANEKKLRVLQVNKMYYPATGGVERLVQQIAEGLNERTDMKVLVCRKKGKGQVDTINGVEVHRASSLGVYFSMPVSFSFFRQLRSMSRDCDVIHLHMPFPLGDLGILLSGFKGKVVVSWHSDVVRQKKLMVLYRPIMERLLKRADAIVVATRGHIDGSAYLGPYRDKCVVVPYAVSEYLRRKAEESTPKQYIPGAPVEFLFVGRLVYYKGCNVLLRAFAKVPNARLTMVGNGVLLGELQNLAEELGIASRVRFETDLPDSKMAVAFENSDVFVLPSVERSEAFGLVQIEAMAYGKPVINTWLKSGVPYVSLNGKTGLTVNPGDVDALADAMKKLAADPALREQYGKAARERVQKNFTTELMLDQLMKVYQW